MAETPERQSLSPMDFNSPPSRGGILKSPPFPDEVNGNLSRSPPLKIVRQESLVSPPLHARTMDAIEVDESFERVFGKLNLKLSSHFPQPHSSSSSSASASASGSTGHPNYNNYNTSSASSSTGESSTSSSSKMAEMMQAVDLKYQRLQQIASLDTYMDRRTTNVSTTTTKVVDVRATSTTTNNIREIKKRSPDQKLT